MSDDVEWLDNPIPVPRPEPGWVSAAIRTAAQAIWNLEHEHSGGEWGEADENERADYMELARAAVDALFGIDDTEPQWEEPYGFIPSTEAVRNAYIWSMREAFVTSEGEAAREFARWLHSGRKNLGRN